MGKLSKRIEALESTVVELEEILNGVLEDLAVLKSRPVAGRRPLRLEACCDWLKERGGGPIAEIIAAAEVAGYGIMLVRRAKRTLGWKKVGMRWVP